MIGSLKFLKWRWARMAISLKHTSKHFCLITSSKLSVTSSMTVQLSPPLPCTSFFWLFCRHHTFLWKTSRRFSPNYLKSCPVSYDKRLNYSNHHASNQFLVSNKRLQRRGIHTLGEHTCLATWVSLTMQRQLPPSLSFWRFFAARSCNSEASFKFKEKFSISFLYYSN